MDQDIRKRTSEELVELYKERPELMWCGNGCSVPCSHCFSHEERVDFYDEAFGG